MREGEIVGDGGTWGKKRARASKLEKARERRDGRKGRRKEKDGRGVCQNREI